MGTRGYRAYRYRGKWMVVYNHWDSYPSGLGLEMKGKIPVDKVAFEAWLEKTRAWFDEEYKSKLEGEDITFQDSPPQNDLFIEWIYTIDLDNLVFHVDSHPVFRLDNMPVSDEVFVHGIGFDHYGKRCYSSITPEEHRYDSVSPIVDAISAEVLARYAVLQPGICTVAEIIPVLQDVRVRIQVAGLLVAVSTVFEGPTLFSWRIMQQRDGVSDAEVALARTMVVVCLSPQLWSGEYRELSPVVKRGPDSLKGNYWWPASNVCVGLFPQIQDEDTLRAAVVELEEDFMEPRLKPIFVVLFNVWSVAIVQLTWNAGDARPNIKHTKTMPFLPPHFGPTSETEGITALACLGHIVSRELIKVSLDRLYLDRLYRVQPKQETRSDQDSGRFAQLPIELYTNIAAHLYDIKSLMSFALVSERAFEGALPIMRIPHILQSRLVSPVPRLEDAAKKARSLGLEDRHEPERGNERITGRFLSLTVNALTRDGTRGTVTLTRISHHDCRSPHSLRIGSYTGPMQDSGIKITVNDER